MKKMKITKMMHSYLVEKSKKYGLTIDEYLTIIVRCKIQEALP